jgi:hypothetical protein
MKGEVAVEGKLTGSPLLGGMRVALYAMPPQPVMNKLRPHDHFRGKLVGVTTSSHTGAYAINVSDAAAITSSAFNGVVNFEVWAAGHGYWSVSGFSREIVAGNKLVPLFSLAPATPMQATLLMHKLSKRGASVSPSAAADGCWLLAADDGPVWVTLQGMWSTIPKVSKTMSYTTDATSSVSIGVSVNDGPWVSGTDGTTSVTDTGGGEDYPEVSGKTSRDGQTEMEEGFFVSCEISTDSATFPYAVDGGARLVKATPQKARHCVPQENGTTIHLSRTRSYTFGDGINLGSTFGIDLSAVSGYSRETEVKYKYGMNAFACGTHNYPLRSNVSGGVVADYTKRGNPG